MKTADLERSKRLKELGWEQDGHWCWVVKAEHYSCGEKVLDGIPTIEPNEYECSFPYKKLCSAPTAGEMIEWLLGEKASVAISRRRICVFHKMEQTPIEINGNICNALADACAWVLERKK